MLEYCNLHVYIYICYFYYDTLTMYLNICIKMYVKRSFISGNHVSTVFICNQRVRETRWSGEKREGRGGRGCSRSTLLNRPFSARATIVVIGRIFDGVLRDFRYERIACAWRVRDRSHNKSGVVSHRKTGSNINWRIIDVEK